MTENEMSKIIADQAAQLKELEAVVGDLVTFANKNHSHPPWPNLTTYPNCDACIVLLKAKARERMGK